MNEMEVNRGKDVDVDGQHGGTASGDENGGSDQEIVVGIDEDHINFLTSMASDDDSLDCPPEMEDTADCGSRIRIKIEEDEDEDVMAAAESILSRTAERTQQQIYHCEYCNKTFTWLKSLTVHLRTHTNVKPYKCELCDRSFVRSDYLKYHIMKSHETNEQVFTCTACSGVFATNRGLLRHIRTEHGGNAERKDRYSTVTDCPSDSESYGDIDENGRFSCTYCDDSFDSRELLVVHMKRHLGEKPFRCDLCSKSFIRQDFLQCHRSNHLKTMDFKQNGYPAETTTKRPRISLKKLEDLVQSNSVSRAESSEEEAADGGASSSDSDNNRDEYDEPRSNGEETEEQKSLLEALLREVSRTDDDRWQCPRCEKTFSQEAALKGHLRSHTAAAQFKCPLCSLAFIRSDYLKNHLKKHIEDNGEDPGAPGSIDTSTFAFGSSPLTNASIASRSAGTGRSISLLKPLNARPQSTGISLLKPPEERKPPEQQEYCIRTDDGKFMCTVCERVFSHQQTVRIHFRIHTNEKPYKCNYCSESFIRSDYLERHVKIHWKDGPVGAPPPVVGKSSTTGIGASDSSDSTSPQKLTIGRAGLLPENYHFVEAGDGQYACKICEQVFTHSDSLRKHALTHTEEKPFFCDVCDRSFNRVDYLKEHFKSKRHRQALAEANGEPLEDDDDSTMDTSYASRIAKTKSPISPMTNALADRIEFQRTDDGRYKCSECDKTFVTAVTLKMHLRLHTGEKPYKCSKCSMAFIRSDYLKTHEKIHRQEGYMSNQNLTSRENSSGDEDEDEDDDDDEDSQQAESTAHHNGQPEPVRHQTGSVAENGEEVSDEDQEDEEDESEDEQVIEVMIKEEDSDDDDDDEEEEEQDADEDQNEQQEDEDNENNNSYENEDSASRVSVGAGTEVSSGQRLKHRCNLCKKEFAWPKSLKIHLRTHTGERPYECDVCGKSFTRSDSLKAHRSTHGDVRVLQCHLCDASFPSGGGLIRHQKHEHGIEPLDGY